jgi:hypothetical protein
MAIFKKVSHRAPGSTLVDRLDQENALAAEVGGLAPSGRFRGTKKAKKKTKRKKKRTKKLVKPVAL